MRRKRQAVPGGRQRSMRVVLSDDEHAAVTDAAEAAALTPTGFVAEAGVLAARGQGNGEPGALRAAGAELLQARTQLVRVGTNLNQAVAKLNATGVASAALWPAVDAAVSAIAAVESATRLLVRVLRR